MENFPSLAKRFHPLLYKTGRSFTDTEADFQDLYQEMLIQLWQSLPRFKEQSALSTYVYRVVLNTAMTYRRQNKKHRILDELPETGLVDDGPSAEEKEQEVNLLYKAIHALPPADRSIMLLYLDDKKYQEIAEILGITPSNVGVKINRIKKKLYTELKRLGYAGT
ncbi:MAG TPA: hypothetical protein DCE41_21280 [Cytophagales bacterium]|nr:hypothetical protein [Cytophagales bacterium]HAA21474.1 hypothetical protein [Cytophagales bacterium]HAP65220.1 hypothetical protein [Cytophagales bacterium]